jgi:hypothetical protein
MKAFEIYTVIRNVLVTISKLSCIILCIYFMIKANQYQVNWNLMTWIIPSNWLIWINYKLSSVGTYVLILPLSVIVTSFLYKDSKVINMLAALFGVMGLLLTILRGVRDGTLNEYLDLRVFTVYHEVTLEAKREFFMAEYHKLVTDLVLITVEKLKYFNEYVGSTISRFLLDMFISISVSSSSFRNIYSRIIFRDR